MRGKVIAYSDAEGRGLISGDDGRRYTFLRGTLGAGLRVVRPGQDVDFQVNGDQAQAIYVAIPAASTKNSAAATAAVPEDSNWEMSVFCNLGPNSLGLRSIFVPRDFSRTPGRDRFRSRRVKRHFRVRVSPPTAVLFSPVKLAQ